MDCFCGEAKFDTLHHLYHEVTPAGETLPANGKKLDLAQCLSCGVIRQPAPPFSTAGFAEYYRAYPPTDAQYGVKGYAHDLELGRERCTAYKVAEGERILDVGSGSGAFVAACRELGAEAYGCEIAEYADNGATEHTYRGAFEDIHFPTAHFDRVTCHDVLEHSLDPLRMLEEVARVLKPGGTCTVDYPNYFATAGDHHWKQEHLWYLTEAQLADLVGKAGLGITAALRPVESKIVIHATRPEQERPSILLPPGLGDSYWSITKMRAFLQRENLGIPELRLACKVQLNYDGHLRSFPFLEMYPFVDATTKVVYQHVHDNHLKKIWQEAYMRKGRTLFRGVLDCDYFLSYNGWLRHGHQMEELDPDLETEWRPPMFVSLEQERFRRNLLEQTGGRYIAFYVVFHGTYKYWTRELIPDTLGTYIANVCAKAQAVPVIMGAAWDAAEGQLQRFVNTTRKIVRKVTGRPLVDLRGQTTVEQAFGAMRGAQAVVGYPSGLTIMAAVLNCPTLMIWNDFYNRQFFYHCVPPDTRGTTYHVAVTKDSTAASLQKDTEFLLEGREQALPADILEALRRTQK